MCTLFCNSDPGAIQVWLQGFHSYLELKGKGQGKETDMKCFLLELSNGFLDVMPRTQGIGKKLYTSLNYFLKSMLQIPLPKKENGTKRTQGKTCGAHICWGLALSLLFIYFGSAQVVLFQDWKDMLLRAWWTCQMAMLGSTKNKTAYFMNREEGGEELKSHNSL